MGKDDLVDVVGVVGGDDVGVLVLLELWVKPCVGCDTRDGAMKLQLHLLLLAGERLVGVREELESGLLLGQLLRIFFDDGSVLRKETGVE